MTAMDELRFQSELNEMWWDLSDSPEISEETEGEFMGYAYEATRMFRRFKRRRVVFGALTAIVVGLLMSVVPLGIVILIVELLS